MSNLKLDTAGDLALESNRLVLVSGVDEIRQRWLIAIRTILGEWFLDRNVGVPYFDVPDVDYNGRAITDKLLNKRTLQQIFADATRRVDGVIAVKRVTVGDIDVQARSVDLTVEATIEGENGDSQEFTFDSSAP